MCGRCSVVKPGGPATPAPHLLSVTAGQRELPTCPVCLERLDEDASGLVTTVGHTSCAGWALLCRIMPALPNHACLQTNPSLPMIAAIGTVEFSSFGLNQDLPLEHSIRLW